MAGYVDVLIGQMEILASLIVIGLFAQRAKLISDENITNFSVFLTRLILPCMLITMVGNGGTREELFGMWKFFLCTAAILSLVIVIAYGLAKAIRLPKGTDNVHVLVTAYGNGGFLGIPIVAVMFPEKAGLVGAVFLMVEATMYWAVGPLIADNGSDGKKVSLKKLISPLTIAIVIGVLIILLNLDLRGFVIWDTIGDIGGTTKYFASVYIGAELGRKGFKEVFANPKVFTSVPFKLILFPVLTYFLFGKTGILQGEELIMLVFLTGTPTGMAVPILAAMGNSNQAYATAGTMINTVLCLVTMPFVMWLVTTVL